MTDRIEPIIEEPDLSTGSMTEVSGTHLLQNEQAVVDRFTKFFNNIAEKEEKDGGIQAIDFFNRYLFTIADARETEVSIPRRRLFGVLPGSLGLIAASGETGKSMIVIKLAADLLLPKSEGYDIETETETETKIGKRWDFKPPVFIPGKKLLDVGSRRILYVSAEDSLDVLNNRLHAAGFRRSIDAGFYLLPLPDLGGAGPLATGSRPGYTSLQQTTLFQEILAQIRIIKPVLVIIDPLSAFSAGSENDNATASQFADILLKFSIESEIADDIRPAIIILHHINKESIEKRETTRNAVRGASAIVDRQRWVATLTDHGARGETDEYKTQAVQAYLQRNGLLKVLSFKIRKSNYGPKVNTGLIMAFPDNNHDSNHDSKKDGCFSPALALDFKMIHYDAIQEIMLAKSHEDKRLRHHNNDVFQKIETDDGFGVSAKKIIK